MSSSLASAQSPDNHAPQAKAAPFPLSQVRLLDGPFKERQDVHLKYLLMVEPDRLLAPFRAQAGLPKKAEHYGGWESRDIAGHSLGHYLSALAWMHAATGDARLRERVDHIVDELAACQQANGDGYVLPVKKQAFEDLRAGKITVSGFALNGVWVPFYTLHKVLAGLRDAHRLCGNAKALEVERKVCDWLDGVLAPLSAEQIQQVLRCEHGGMNEVLADLAADTGDGRYLKMAARDFHQTAVLDPMMHGEDKLNGLHGNTQIPKVIGLAREFELTGEPQYRTAAESFWDNVVNRRSYAIGGHGESEHFFPPEKFPEKLTPNTCETCNTYNMLKLTEHLFEWEPRAAQMDFEERALINHLLANIGRQPGEFGYFLGLASVGMKVFSTQFDSWWCCVGTGLENPARYGEQIYFHNDGALWVNHFIASKLAWPGRGVTLTQETKFPDADTTRLVFKCDKPAKFALKIRHPYWCAKPELKINGETVSIESNESYMTYERTWKNGDTVEVRLPMTLRLEPLPHSDGKIVAAMFGPMVLAGIVPAEPGVPDPAKKRYGDHLSARGKTDDFPPLFVASGTDAVLAHFKPTGKAFAEFRAEGVAEPADLTFEPFHRIYEEHYAVYFSMMTPDEWTRRAGELRAEKERQQQIEAATLDIVTPGYQQPEVEHSLKSEGSRVSDFHDRKWRDATDGGWFSYEMKADPAAPMTLACTYWGGEWHERVFDILVDGEKLATQKLHVNKPGEFFDVTYAIPPALTKGKTKVTVRFQSHPHDIAGGVFGLRMTRSGTPH